MQGKNHLDIIVEKIKSDPNFYEQLATNPDKALKEIGVELTDNEKAILAELGSRNLSYDQLQTRLSANLSGEGG